MLVGPPGVGKTIAIGAAANYFGNVEGFHVSPTSMTGASLVDALMAATRRVDVDVAAALRGENGIIEFNSMLLKIDDLQALLHKYEHELIANMTVFYDTEPYIQTRRTTGLRIEINSPQISMLTGTTNSHLLTLLPEGAWEQGFMGRTIMICANDRPLQDDMFADSNLKQSPELTHDLALLFNLRGQFAISPEFNVAVNNWRREDCPPKPSHPKLKDYCPRRPIHLLKLAMVSSADRSDKLILEMYDFERAKSWLVGAERTMPDVFSGAASPDSRIMQEIIHLLGDKEVIETKINRLISERVNAHTVKRFKETMIENGMLKARVDPKTKRIYFKAMASE
jgi:hypothetical protein